MAAIALHRLSAVRLCCAALALALVGCDSEATTNEEPEQTASVVGTWRGTVNTTGAGQTLSYPQILVLTQSGTTVSGTANYDPPDPADQGTLTGSVAGSKFTAHVVYPKSNFDDCGNYPADIIATVSGNKMTVTGGTAYDCTGDGHGGHSSLITLTLTSGTLTKQ